MANERRYVIDLEDIGNGLWRAKGFRTLVFDEVGISKLTSVEDAFKEEVNYAVEREMDRRGIIPASALDVSYMRGKHHGRNEAIESMCKAIRKTVNE